MERVKRAFMGWAGRVTSHALTLFVQMLTAVRADWRGCEPVPHQRVYYANHVSNGDMPMIWASLPPGLRRNVRPVAAADYWLKTPMRRFIGYDVFNTVLRSTPPKQPIPPI